MFPSIVWKLWVCKVSECEWDIHLMQSSSNSLWTIYDILSKRNLIYSIQLILLYTLGGEPPPPPHSFTWLSVHHWISCTITVAIFFTQLQSFVHVYMRVWEAQGSLPIMHSSDGSYSQPHLGWQDSRLHRYQTLTQISVITHLITPFIIQVQNIKEFQHCRFRAYSQKSKTPPKATHLTSVYTQNLLHPITPSRSGNSW